MGHSMTMQVRSSLVGKEDGTMLTDIHLNAHRYAAPVGEVATGTWRLCLIHGSLDDPRDQVRQPMCQAIGAIGKLAPDILALSTGESSLVPGYFDNVFKSLGDIHLHVPFHGKQIRMLLPHL